jgi:hypothetical protein
MKKDNVQLVAFIVVGCIPILVGMVAMVLSRGYAFGKQLSNMLFTG